MRLALLLSHGALPADQQLDLLGWSRECLSAATTARKVLIGGGPLRLAATDQHLACPLRPGPVPDDIRHRFTSSKRLAAALTTMRRTKSCVSHLLRPSAINVAPTRRPAHRARRTRFGGRGVPDLERPAAGDCPAGPDLLFALRLTETPAAAAS
jgi:hypothetical protein